MGIKSFLAKPFARYISRKIYNESRNALFYQQYWFNKIVSTAKDTRFGKDHHFNDIVSYEAYTNSVPVSDYEGLKLYIDASLNGEENILWPGKPLYWAKTSGTTSGIKYIPVSKDSISFHINSARNALLCYIAETGNSDFVDGKLIFLSGSPELDKKNGVYIGRLSGIVNHHIPVYLKKNQMPAYETNCIEDWEQKVNKITEETKAQNMTLISGIPPWVQMYFDKLTAATGKKIKDIFPNFNLFVYGGVNFEPYRAKIEESIGKKVDSIETYPASEGFIAFQDSQQEKGLLLLTNNGIFYEFIPTEEFFDENPTRISLKSVELNKNYVLILNTNAGLYGYNIGDTVKFVSLHPYRIIVTGRIKHFISAFGEHVIGEEVEGSLMEIAASNGIQIIEFTVAPQVNPDDKGLPYHEWFIEFASSPENMQLFATQIDEALQRKNIYYKDLIAGGILRPLVIRKLSPGTFIEYMKSEGKLGGQNKVPRLSNDRKIAEKLKHFITEYPSK
ncbi:MAG: GH3 auxin-responsive promoter family protein [Bacteroidota bacterium]|nr:GH3 auxin-responsive promoter family protein [Bacteroidota bacterium]